MTLVPKLESNEYYEQIKKGRELIQAMPTSEVKYWLRRFFDNIEVSILEERRKTREGNSPRRPIDYHDMLNEANRLLEATHEFLISTDLNNEERIAKIQDKVNAFYKAVKKPSLCKAIVNAFMRFLGCVSSIICSAIGGTVGLLAGLFNRKDFIPGGAVGLVTGIMIGGMLGIRIPQKVLNRSLQDDRDDTLNQIRTLYKDGLFKKKETNYINKIKQDWLARYFNNNEAKFQEFLKAPQTFKILSAPAGYFLKQLQGHLGQHLFIRFDINKNSHIIELGLEGGQFEEKDLKQSEQRQVTGETLLAMEALHQRVKPQIHTINRILSFYKPGERDCHTYIDMVLSATNQPLHQLSRFIPQDNPMTHFLFTFFSNNPKYALMKEKQESQIGIRVVNSNLGRI